jgi:hypothetical protein
VSRSNVRRHRRFARLGHIATTAATLLTALALAACDSSEDEQSTTTGGTPTTSDREIPGGADPAEVQVIDEWSMTLAEGDVRGAARFFAFPSIAQNGPTIHIFDLDDARLFNASLPCGATLERAETEGEYTVATFRLTERPGPGSCGDGTGAEAQTAFLIEDGKIVEWRRVVEGDPGGSGRPV